MTAPNHDIPAPSATLRGNDCRSVAVLLPYLLKFRGRVLLARYHQEAVLRYGERTGTDMAGSLRSWIEARRVH